MEKKTNIQNPANQGPDGTATHSGWSHFYVLFSKYRDECLKVGQIVFGVDSNVALKYITNYHSALYSMAQQIFPFYDQELEEEITNDWFKLSDKINEVISLASDDDFRDQMICDGIDFIPRDLKTKLLMFFNRINRLASDAGLLVGKENKELVEPKKGLMGFRK